jgi:hypothetical protein
MSFRLPALVAGLSLLAGAVAADHSDHNFEFTITNNSSQPLTEVYAILIGAESWGADILAGQNAILTGNALRLTLNGHETECEWAFLFVFEDDSDRVEELSLCEFESLELLD